MQAEERYGYLRLFFMYEGDVVLMTTEPSTLQKILYELGRQFPEFGVAETMPLPDGGDFLLRLTRLGDPAAAVGWWIAQKLCHLGWEPLGGGDSTYHFRKRIPR